MSSVVAQLQARLAAKRKDAASPAPAPVVPAVSLISYERMANVRSLELACQIFVSNWELCYQDYMAKAIAVFEATVDASMLAEYCDIGFVDTCICGVTNGIITQHLHTHCCVCKGASGKRNYQYEIQRLASATGIHYSWLEYGFAKAIHRSMKHGN